MSKFENSRFSNEHDLASAVRVLWDDVVTMESSGIHTKIPSHIRDSQDGLSTELRLKDLAAVKFLMEGWCKLATKTGDVRDMYCECHRFC